MKSNIPQRIIKTYESDRSVLSMSKYMITGSTGADVRSFLPRFIIPPVYDNLNDAKPHAMDLVAEDLRKLEKIETDFEIKTNDLSWEIIDKNGIIWEHIYIQKID